MFVGWKPKKNFSSPLIPWELPPVVGEDQGGESIHAHVADGVTPILTFPL